MACKNRREIITGAVAGLVAGGLYTRRAAAKSPDIIRFGLTPVFLSSDAGLLDRLQSYLRASAGYEVELVQRRTYQEVTALLLSGTIDAAWICGYPFVKNRTRLQLVAVPVWHGRPLYQSYIITSKNRSKATRFAGLRGDIHAFSDPNSNSGFLVTRALLAGLHETPESFFTKSFFTYGHRNVVRAVAAGLAGSGSVDGYVWEVMRTREPELINQTRVIRKSEWLGFPPVACARSTYKSPKVTAIGRALLAMNQNRDGKAVLEMLGLDGFDRFPDSIFDGIARKVALVESG